MKKRFTILMIVTTILTNAQLPSYVSTNGLVAYYPFTGNANDASGNGNNGVVNGATLTSDRFGNINNAYYFSSNGCLTRIDAAINTSNILSQLTISVWILRSGDGCIAPRVIDFYTLGDGPGNASIGWDNNGYGNIGSVTSSSNIISTNWSKPLNNIWTHLVYTNDGSIAKFYQDGILFNSIASIGNPILSGNAAFGRMNHSAWDAFNGKIDDIGIWNRALTEQEITNLYNADNTCQSLVINTGILSFNPPTYQNTVTIYPNPANDHITIDCGNLANVSGWHVVITNTLGQEVFNQPMNTQQYVVPLNSWTGQGVYFVKIYDASNNLMNTKKIILQ